MQHNYKYRDKSRYPNVTDHYETEMKMDFSQMLVQMGKDFGNKLKEILL